MTEEEISNECQDLYATIKGSQDRLAELRKLCLHLKTHIGNYENRPGQIWPCRICRICGKPIAIISEGFGEIKF